MALAIIERWRGLKYVSLLLPDLCLCLLFLLTLDVFVGNIIWARAVLFIPLYNVNE